MPAAITDKFNETTNGSRPEATTVTGTRSVAGTTLSCGALTGWPTATAVHFATYRTDAQGDKVAGSQCDWKGVVSGTQITNLTLKAGTDVGNAIGETVVCMPTAAWADDVVEGLTTTVFDQDGTLKAGAVDNAAALASNVVTTAKILDANVTTAKIADGAITPAKSSNPYKFSVYRNAAQNTASGSYTKINFDTELYDTNSNFDSTTNYRYTAPVAGYYEFNWQANLAAGSTDTVSAIYKNGTILKRGVGTITSGMGTSGHCEILAAANDYFEIFIYSNAVVALSLSQQAVSFDGHLVSIT